MRSNLEKRIAQQLEEANVSYKYEATSYEYWIKQYKCECLECGGSEVRKWHWYTPDFFLSNGVVIETKGRMTPKDRKIVLAMKEQWPNVDLRVVFGTDNKMHKSSKNRYSDWCHQYKIPYAIREIPKEWLHDY
jgi:hypothetical protein